MTVCGEQCLSTIEAGVHKAVTLKCRSWCCEECAPMRRRQLIAQGIGGQPDKFITLTSRKTDGLTKEEAGRQLVEAWRTIRRLYSKEHNGLKIEFMAIFEATKAGWPHLHIIARSMWISQDWLSKTMDRLTGSPVVWIEAITNKKKIAAYCAKYVGKNPHKFGTLKRYWQSARYQTEEKPEPHRKLGWTIEKMHLQTWAAMFHEAGFEVHFLHEHHATARRLC